MLYNTASWSEGGIIPEESYKHDDILEHWILISSRFYNRRTGYALCIKHRILVILKLPDSLLEALEGFLGI